MTKQDDKNLYRLNTRKGTVRELEDTPYQAELRKIREEQADEDHRFRRTQDDDKPTEITVSLEYLKKFQSKVQIGEDEFGFPVYEIAQTATPEIIKYFGHTPESWAAMLESHRLNLIRVYKEKELYGAL